LFVTLAEDQADRERQERLLTEIRDRLATAETQ